MPIDRPGLAADLKTIFEDLDPTKTAEDSAESLAAAIDDNHTDGGSGGGDLSDDNPEPLGSADPGASTEASRSDHVHEMPDATDVGAEAAGVAAGLLAAHVAAGDPHTQYATEAALAAGAAPVAWAGITGAPSSFPPDGAAGGDLGGTYPNPTVTDLTIASEARGDLLMRGAASWGRLAPGTSGYALLSSGAGADLVWGSVYTPGGTDVAVADGGTGSSTAPGARTNLGLAIGSDVAAYDAGIASLAGQDGSIGLPYVTAANTWLNVALGDLSVVSSSWVVTQARGLRETSGPTTLVAGAITDGEFVKRVGSTLVSAAITGAPSGSAGGDLGGTYPNPTVTQARGLRETAGPTSLSVGAVADGQVLIRSGSTIIGAYLAAALTVHVGDPYVDLDTATYPTIHLA